MYDYIAEKTGLHFPTSGEMVSAATPYLPNMATKPANAAERYAEAIGEFIPGAFSGGSEINLAKSATGRVLNAVADKALTAGKYAVAPAVAVQTVQELDNQHKLPAWAAPAAGLVTTGAAALAHKVIAPSSAGRNAVANAFEGVTPEQLSAAESLMGDARSQGIGLTWAEALQHTTGGATNGANLQRVVEGQGGLREFMGQRPDQIRAANERMFADIAETPNNPSAIGPRVGDAATSVINQTTKDINAVTAPRYKAAESGVVPASDMARLTSDPLFAATLKDVRSDPTLNRRIAHLPDNSPVVLDEVQRIMGGEADNAMKATSDRMSRERAANLTDARDNVRNTADAASLELAGARETNRVLREIHLKPLMEGPIGQLASKDITTKAAVDALFPQNPIPNSSGEVSAAVSALSAKNPWAARQLVRAHVEGVINQATKELQSGANEFGGASFRSKLIGNKSQAENLAAAIHALPNGETTLKGFDRLMEMMEATGQRQRVGSQTAFNQEALAALKEGSTIGEVVATGGVKLPQKFKDKLAAWNLGSNVDEVSRLLSDPNAAPAFKQLVTAKRGSGTEVAAIGRLVSIAGKPVGNQKR
jgi:hypothetical protein